MPEDLNMANKLYYGDNLIIMREFIPDECVDLIYLDPPFNSKATYNVLFHEKDGSKGSETRDLMRIRTGADLPGTSQGFDCHRSAVH